MGSFTTVAAFPNPFCLIELPSPGASTLYEVRAKDMAGQYSEPASLLIGFVPPQEIHPSNVTATSFNVRWSVPPGSAGVTGYQLALNGASPFDVVDTSYGFFELRPGTQYVVTVCTRDDADRLSEPASVIVTTRPA